MRSLLVDDLHNLYFSVQMCIPQLIKCVSEQMFSKIPRTMVYMLGYMYIYILLYTSVKLSHRDMQHCWQECVANITLINWPAWCTKRASSCILSSMTTSQTRDTLQYLAQSVGKQKLHLCGRTGIGTPKCKKCVVLPQLGLWNIFVFTSL